MPGPATARPHNARGGKYAAKVKREATKPLPDLPNIDIVRPPQVLTVPVVAGLISRGQSNADIARLFGVSAQAVSQFIQRHDTQLACLKDADAYLSAKLKAVTIETIDSIDMSCIQKAGLRDRVISAGVMIDKQRLIDGQSTANISMFSHIIQSACTPSEVPDPPVSADTDPVSE